MEIIRKYILAMTLIVFLTTVSGIAAAVNDSTGDVWHYKQAGGNWSWEQYTGTKPNIDITDISYSIDGTQATLTMTINGEIQNSENIFYYMHLVSDSGTYQAYYSNNQGLVIGSGEYSGFYNTLENPVSGNTFTATFEVDNPSASYEIWAYAAEYTSVSDTDSSEWWGDYAPASYAPWYSGSTTPNGETGNGNNDGDTPNTGTGIPGFEILTLFAAITVGIIVLGYKKRK